MVDKEEHLLPHLLKLLNTHLHSQDHVVVELMTAAIDFVDVEPVHHHQVAKRIHSMMVVPHVVGRNYLRCYYFVAAVVVVNVQLMEQKNRPSLDYSVVEGDYMVVVVSDYRDVMVVLRGTLAAVVVDLHLRMLGHRMEVLHRAEQGSLVRHLHNLLGQQILAHLHNWETHSLERHNLEHWLEVLHMVEHCFQELHMVEHYFQEHHKLGLLKLIRVENSKREVKKKWV